MSIIARLKRIEGKLSDESKATEKLKVSIEGLLFMDYEEFREVYTEWIMASYMEQHEKADELNTKGEHLIKTLVPITKRSQFDFEAYESLVAIKIVDWMEEHGIKDIDDAKRERVFCGD
ncbi:hypothetical protein AB4X15_25615 [Peribacillus simplex]|uniref:hypothetical protein n=1 Tax=Peribacillus simplex TaxID=1478 RepID=UPI0034E89C3E